MADIKHAFFFSESLLTLALMLGANTAHAATPREAAEQLDAFIQAIPDLGPGYAVTVVTADEVLLERTLGERNAATGAPLTPDTPIYIASQTKAYVGLLAANLDERGILDLDDTLADHWPADIFPEGVDPTAWTLRDLLSHEVPLEVGLITTLEAYVTRVRPEDYPRLIKNFGEAREPGFRYANLGYNLYTAILEQATGKRWQAWLDEVIFDPLNLAHTSARTTDFPLDDLAWSHIWQGDGPGAAGGWYPVRPKTDGKMQSAGGLVSSTGDMARFLQLQLGGEMPVSGLTPSMVKTAQTSYAETGMEDGRNPYELPCSGYSLGWNLCDFQGHTVYIHGGGYTGNRTMMAFSPDLGVGVAAFSNSDNMTGWLTSRTVTMFLQFLVDDPDAEKWRTARIDQYPKRTAQLLDHRQKRDAEQRADERWNGWTWAPTTADLDAYVGHWAMGEPYLDLRIVREGDSLVLHWGDIRETLQPASPDLFAAQTAPFESLEAFRFSRDADGAITGLEWDDRNYRRAAVQ